MILFEWQILQGGQFHWEQPAGSAMWHLAPLHAILAQTFHAHFDMCRMGDLRDPASGAHLRKPMSVLTTSEALFQTLHQKRCQDEHDERVPIAGITQTPLGPMNLSQWSSLYTRKFAFGKWSRHSQVLESGARSPQPFWPLVAESSRPQVRAHQSASASWCLCLSVGLLQSFRKLSACTW